MIAVKLRNLAASVPVFTPESLAAYFGVPPVLFTQATPSAPIVFHQAGAALAVSYALRGTIFFPITRTAVRGLSRVLATSDYATEAAAAHNDRSLIEALTDGEGVIETKEPGIAVRLYYHKGKYHFASNNTHDGSEGLVGAGIDNARALGIDIASQARNICDRSYAKAYRLAKLGYVPVFALLLPERETYVAADHPDLVLIDVIDPDHEFVDRLEKERIAEDYALNIVRAHGRIGGVTSPGSYFSRIRALEMQATQNDLPGFVVKARGTSVGHLSVKAEPAECRAWSYTFDETDVKAAFDAVTIDFSDTVLTDTLLEELMLEYLGNRRRAVRWQVASWIAAR